MINKKWRQVVWQTRKRYGRQILKKSQLKEAFQLYKAADENIEKFQELVKEALIKKWGEKKQTSVN